jgi:thioredoxin 1
MNRKYISVLIFLLAIVGIFFLKSEQNSKKSLLIKDDKLIKKEDNKSPALPLLLEIGSSTCVPCKMMAPILEELTNEQKSKLKVKFIDIKNNKTVAQKYGISIIPTQIFYDANGTEFFRHEGFYSKKDILSKFQLLKTSQSQ